MHQKAIKERKLKVDEFERDKVFLQEQVIKQRNITIQIKKRLQLATKNYDSLYMAAQDFLKRSDDKEKCKELLNILEETEDERT